MKSILCVIPENLCLYYPSFVRPPAFYSPFLLKNLVRHKTGFTVFVEKWYFQIYAFRENPTIV